MIPFKGPAQPSPTLDIALDMVRRPRPRRSTSLNANAFSIHARRQGSSRGQDRGPQITLACRMSLTLSGE